MYWLTPQKPRRKNICSVTLGATIIALILTTTHAVAIAVIPAVGTTRATAADAIDAAVINAAAIDVTNAAATAADSAATTDADGIPVPADVTIFFGCRRR